MGIFSNHYCADCTWMSENEGSKKGKYKCEGKCPFDEVYADRSAGDCRQFTDAWSRGSSTKNDLYSISRRSHYLVTAISDILDLGDDNRYHAAFEYMRDVYLPAVGEEGINFMEDYNELAPLCAEKLMCEEEKEAYAEYLRSQYLEPFTTFIEMNNNQAAFDIYGQMYATVKNKYGLKRDIHKKILVNPDAK